MKSAVVLSFILSLIFSFSNGSVFLEFAEDAHSEDNMNVYLSINRKKVLVDATARSHQYVYLADTVPSNEYELTFHCHVTNATKDLDLAYFCCKDDKHVDGSCEKLDVSQTVSCGHITYNYKYDKSSGVEFTYKPSPSEKERKGVISCKLGKGETVIESNGIEIRDWTYFYQDLKPSSEENLYNYIWPLYDLDLPAAFDCFTRDMRAKLDKWPSWTRQSISRFKPFMYKFCRIPADRTIDAHSCLAKSIENLRNFFISSEGVLYLTEPFDDSSYALVCHEKASNAIIRHSFVGNTTYVKRNLEISKGLSFMKGLPPNATDYKLKALSPVEQEIELGINSELGDYLLSALYRRSVAGAKYEWTKDGSMYLETPNTAFNVKLAGIVKETMAGEYKLAVEDKNNKMERINFVFRVTVVGPPQFEDTNCLSNSTYIVEGENFISVCNLNKPANVLVAVNGILGNSSSQLKSELQRQLTLVNNKLSKLDISLVKINDGRKVELNLQRIQADQDCRLSLQASNDHGKSMLQAFIYVLPKPIMSVYPSYSNCKVDCDQDSFTVEAQLDPSYQTMLLTKFNISYTTDWLINEEFSTENENADILKFIQFDRTKPETITINPGYEKTNETNADIVVKQVNQARSLHEFLVLSKKNADIDELRVKVLYRFYVMTPSVKLVHSTMIVQPHYESEKNSLEKAGGRLIYDSRFETDPDVNAVLTSYRRFTPRVVSSSIAWIVAVVIGIFILVAIVILSAWLCHRTKRSTYALRATEQKQGLDPEADMQMEKPFKPFCSESDACLQHQEAEVHSDEDGELDYSGEDLKKKPIIQPSRIK